MDNWRDEVAILQAQLAAQQMALRALIQSHPQPAALLQQWRELRADRGPPGAHCRPGFVPANGLRSKSRRLRRTGRLNWSTP